MNYELLPCVYSQEELEEAGLLGTSYLQGSLKKTNNRNDTWKQHKCKFVDTQIV